MVDKIEKILKALGDKSRLRIINILSERSLCVYELTEVLKLSQSTVSGHLRVLKDARIVEDKKDGLWVEYRLCKDYKFNSDIVNLINEALKSGRKMEDERKMALQANREVICKR